MESAEDRSGQVTVDDRRRRVTPDASRTRCPTSTAPFSSSGPAAARGRAGRDARATRPVTGAVAVPGNGHLDHPAVDRVPTVVLAARSSSMAVHRPPVDERSSRGHRQTFSDVFSDRRRSPSPVPTTISIHVEGAPKLVNATDRFSPSSPPAWFRRPPAKSAVWFPAGRHRQTSPMAPGASHHQ